MKKSPFLGFESVEARGKYIVCRVYEHEETASGLVISEGARQEMAPWFEVISVGSEVTTCEAGDMIYCQKRAYQPIFVGDEMLLVGSGDSVLAKVKLSPKQQRFVDERHAELKRQSTIDGEVERMTSDGHLILS